jgi:hypothetical protein
MSLTVRFPSGVSMTYNDVNYIDWGDGERIYLKRKDEKGNFHWHATVLKSSGAVLEWVRPCQVMAAPIPAGKDMLQELCNAVRDKRISSWDELDLLAQLKGRLRTFNSKRKRWNTT